jgi:8-oxo-dGTP pyrophosphatase MutT (NUDIX family)
VSIQAVGSLIYAKSTSRFLFLLRNGAGYTNTWGLVGGKTELGETAAAALLREIREETGRDFSNAKIIPVDLFTSLNEQFTYNTYLILVDEEFIPTLNDEHKGYAWCDLESYPKPLHPGVYGTFKIDEIQQKIQTVINAVKS